MARYGVANPGDLPPPPVIEELDFESYFDAGKSTFDRLWTALVEENPDLPSFEELSLESEPVIKVLEVLAYRELAVRARVNSGARAVFIGHSFGTNLDNLAAFFGVTRIEGETDGQLRRRVKLAPDALGGSGTEGGYLFHTYQAAHDLKGAKAIVIESDHGPEGFSTNPPGVFSTNPSGVFTTNPPGLGVHREVHILPVSATGDGTPSDDQLNRIRARLADDHVALQTDVVVVRSPEVVPYTVTATLQIHSGPEASVVLQSALDALQDYADERQEVGETVYRAGVVSALRVSPVINVLTDFEDIVVGEDQVTFMADTTVQIEVIL